MPRPVIHVTAVLLLDGPCVALVRKRGTRAWIFPGGKPDAGESAAECGARELAEELGLTVPVTALRGIGRVETEAANEPGHALVAEVVTVCGGLAALGVARESLRPGGEIAELAWHAADHHRSGLAPLTRQVLADVLPVLQQGEVHSGRGNAPVFPPAEGLFPRSRRHRTGAPALSRRGGRDPA